MFPNPQDALPLPPRPSLDRYRKIAKDLAKACKEAGDLPPASDAPERNSSEPADWAESWAEDWAENWIDDLARLSGISFEPELPVRVDRWIDQVAGFAQRQLKGSAAHGRRCALSDAQFVIARSHGFESWPKFVRALESLEHVASSDAKFEEAADAIVSGDVATLKQLLAEAPELIRARSKREHGASLLHYVAANGVENYRQKTPKNIVQIVELLLAAGADIDATAEVYGGGCKTLELAATSGHPERVGVMEELLRMLLDHGTSLTGPIVMSCLNNGRASSAAFLGGILTDRGERISLAEAAGIGRRDLVEKLLAEEGAPAHSSAELQKALSMASGFGWGDVAEFLIQKGADFRQPDRDGLTALHWAVIGGHLGVVTLLLKLGAPLEVKSCYESTPLGQALWSAAHGGDAAVYEAILEALTAAGAKLPEQHVPVNPKIDAWLEEHGSHSEPRWYWYGERPRSAKRPKPKN